MVGNFEKKEEGRVGLVHGAEGRVLANEVRDKKIQIMEGPLAIEKTLAFIMHLKILNFSISF